MMGSSSSDDSDDEDVSIIPDFSVAICNRMGLSIFPAPVEEAS